MKRIFTVIVAIIFLPTLVYAEPVYLNCSNSTGTRRFSLKVDESSGKITHTEQTTQESFNVEGFFAPNTISYKFSQWDTSSQYRINRTTLQYEESLEIKYNTQSKTFNSNGICEIVKVEGRKF